MKKIYDKESIKKALASCKYGDMMSSLQVPLFLIRYEAGEIISAPLQNNNYYQIVIEGNLSIYYIRDDGSTYSLSSGSEGYIIGELEFFTEHKGNVYSEATAPLTTIACDTSLYKKELMNSVEFLRTSATILAKKIEAIMHVDAVPLTLSERVLNFMTYKCEDCTFKGIEKAAFKLNCSARQLQRILNSLEEEGKVKKVGKGAYRLEEEIRVVDSVVNTFGMYSGKILEKITQNENPWMETYKPKKP